MRCRRETVRAEEWRLPILKKILGIDPGSHTIKVVQLQQGFRGLETEQVRAQPRGDGEQTLPELVAGLIEVHQLATEHVVTALRGDRVSVRRLALPFGSDRKLAQAVPFEIEDQLPLDLADVLVDWEVVRRERTRAEVVAAVAPKTAVSELIDTLHDAGCDPSVVEAEGLALANLTAAFDLPGNRVLVDLGHSRTTFCILAEGRPLMARSIDTAGRAITEALAQDRGLDLEEAERVKCEEGVIDPGLQSPLPKVAAAIDRIASEIVRLVASLETALEGAVTQVTLMGGTAQLDRIDELIEERSGLPTARIGLPRETDGLGLVAGGSPVLFAPTIALALRGTTRATTGINFRQDELARRVDLSRYLRGFGWTGRLAAGVAALAVLNFATGTALESRQARQSERQIDALYEEAFPGQPVPDDPLGALRKAAREAHERAEFLGVYRGNLSALDLLAEISRRVPADLEVVFEELNIDRQTIRLRVFSKSFEAADRLGAELAKFGPFADARIGAIESDKRSGGKKFNVTISLAPAGERG
jgi:general secretion pathway protein L